MLSLHAMASRSDAVSGHMAAALRRTFDLSQDEVAHEADVSRRTLTSFEDGSDHRASTARKITEALFRLTARKLPASNATMTHDLGAALKPANEVERRFVLMAIAWLLEGEGEDVPLSE